jgi:hypothetical protein
MKESQAVLFIRFTVECPNCGENHDLTDSDHEGVYMSGLFELEKHEPIQSACAGEEFECVACENPFIITGTDY